MPYMALIAYTNGSIGGIIFFLLSVLLLKIQYRYITNGPALLLKTDLFLRFLFDVEELLYGFKNDPELTVILPLHGLDLFTQLIMG